MSEDCGSAVPSSSSSPSSSSHPEEEGNGDDDETVFEEKKTQHDKLSHNKTEEDEIMITTQQTASSVKNITSNNNNSTTKIDPIEQQQQQQTYAPAPSVVSSSISSSSSAAYPSYCSKNLPQSSPQSLSGIDNSTTAAMASAGSCTGTRGATTKMAQEHITAPLSPYLIHYHHQKDDCQQQQQQTELAQQQQQQQEINTATEEAAGGNFHNLQQQQQSPTASGEVKKSISLQQHHYHQQQEQQLSATTTTSAAKEVDPKTIDDDRMEEDNDITTTSTNNEYETMQSVTASSISSSFISPDVMTHDGAHPQQQQECNGFTSSPSIGYGKGVILKRLSEALIRGTLTLINLSQRALSASDANLIKFAIVHNPQLSVLKLGYNCLGDEGVALIASAIGCVENNNDSGRQQHICHHQHHHHPSLSILDLGFNCVGDVGCAALATHVVSNNFVLQTLYLSGNTVGERGSIALASAMLNGCGLTCLHLTANRIGTHGVKALTRTIAENEAKRQILLQRQHNNELEGGAPRDAIDTQFGIIGGGKDLAFKSIQELFLGGVGMGPNGCLAVSNMILTNFSLRVLCLSDNGIDDRDIALFSQSISRNKRVPLEVLQLSFNRLTCVGVESLMNAIWGSSTLREVWLDNNRIHDRGAQLAAVVLTSVKLEVLDLGFNRITTGGIKALMKSLAENDTLLSLTLSGNPLDTNASKAVSYALAYNKSLRALYVDNCSVGYAAQRHITAGIVSNSQLSLRVITGFHIGAIAVTLGLPSALENWTNEQVLKFIRLMWDRRRHDQESMKQRNDQPNNTGVLLSSAKNDDTATKNTTQPDGTSPKHEKQKVGPSDPATVVAAAKSAFASLGDAGGAILHSEPNQREQSDGSPLVPSDAIMLEKTLSGTVRVPKFDNEGCSEDDSLGVSSLHMSTDSLSVTNLRSSAMHPEKQKKMELPIDPTRKKRNVEWLRQHFFSLNEVAQLPFNHADLWKLHQYFFSPIESSGVNNGEKVEIGTASSTSLSDKVGCCADPSTAGQFDSQRNTESYSNSLLPNRNERRSEVPPQLPAKLTRKSSVPGLSRKVSYRVLTDALSATPITSNCNSNGFGSAGRRRTISVLGDNGVGDPISQPASKRARNNKLRIAYYPRIKEKLELLRSKADQQNTLILLRQLKFVESVMFKGRDIYSESRVGVDDPNLATLTGTIDVEIILVDML